MSFDGNLLRLKVDANSADESGVGLSATTTVPQGRGEAAARPSAAAWLRPSLLDCLLVALILWLIGFTASGGTAGLLQDAGAGYHVRVGDYILNRHAIPRWDVFSFTRGGQPWYAWEWLSGVLFSILHDICGLKGIVLLSAAVIAATVAVMVRHLIWRGANALVALLLIHVAIAVCSLHFLARPHLVTMLFMAVSMYMIDRDRAQPLRHIYLLIPLTVLWVNLHGGFIALPVSLFCLAIGAQIAAWCGRGAQPAVRRYGLLGGACLLASGLNPYGFTEHVHIVRFMQAGWVRRIILEYQQPSFAGVPGLYIELVVIGAGMLVLRLLLKGDIPSALLAGFWLHAALQSVRHLPLLAIVILPMAAVEIQSLWDRCMGGAPRRSTRATLAVIASDFSPALGRVSVWPAVAVAVIGMSNLLPFPDDFPEPRYPVSIVNRNAGLLINSRVFSTDAWGDYLDYRFFPYGRVFIDGRCDMYGPALADEYMVVLNGMRGWDRVLAHYGVNAALVPASASIASLLRRDEGWVTVEDGSEYSLFRRKRVTDFGE